MCYKLGKDYPADETAENKGIRITPEREFFNMPPKGAYKVTQIQIIATLSRKSSCDFSTRRNFFTALFKRRTLKNSFLVKNSRAEW